MLVVKLLLIILNIYFVKCDKGSLAFVIDETSSMRDDIDGVKIGATDLLNTMLTKKGGDIDELILVTFRDPETKMVEKTTNVTQFKKSLNSIQPYDYKFNDCPEYALSGLETALIESKSNSYIYVYTDASAKDYFKINEIKNLCAMKGSQVVFIVTGNCDYYEGKSSKIYIYYEIAQACSGLVIELDKNEVQQVTSSCITETLKGKMSLYLWEIKPQSYQYHKIPVTFDDKVDAVILSAVGKRVELILMADPYAETKINTKDLLDSSNSKVLILENPTPITYYAYIRSYYSNVTLSVVVRTDITFDHGFSEFVPRSLEETSRQPTAGKKVHLSILVTDPINSISVKTVKIIGMDDQDIDSHTLRRIGDNFYTTKAFYTPTSMFRIGFTGVVKETGQPIKRFSKTPVTPPLIEEKAPSVVIEEGTAIETGYNTKVTLTCKVSAYPPPEIVWYDSIGNVLEDKSTKLDSPYNYVSYLKLTAKKNQIYICIAKSKNIYDSKEIKLTVTSPFLIRKIPPALTSVEYGKPVSLDCIVESLLPITGQWTRSNRPIQTIPDKVIVSPDQSNLKILRTDIDMQGDYTCKVWLSSDPSVSVQYTTKVLISDLGKAYLKILRTDIDMQGDYTCKVWLSSDPSVSVQYTTKVLISDLATPEISNLKSNVVDNTLHAICRVKGKPEPKIIWKFKSRSSDQFVPIISMSKSLEELFLTNLTIANIGYYKCLAISELGEAEKKFEVQEKDIFVISAPTVVITNGDSIKVNYDNEPVTLTCKVHAYPKPDIYWQLSDGTILNTDILRNTPEISTSELNVKHIKRDTKYTCKAKNEYGNHSQDVHVNVIFPLETISKPPALTSVEYGKPVSLDCIVESLMPITGQWTRSNRPIQTIPDKVIVSADQSNLKILRTDIDMQGDYTCKVWLSSDPSVSVQYTTKVQISDLAEPNVDAITKNIENGTLFVNCRVSGTPSPTINWTFIQKTTNTLSNIVAITTNKPIIGEKLIIKNLTLTNSGYYTCVASNPVGRDQKSIYVETEEPPKIKSHQRVYYGVEGDAMLVILCDVTGFPVPTVLWKNGSNIITIDESRVTIRPDNSLVLINPKESDTNDYTCVASNILGVDTKTFTVVVMDEFQNEENIYGKTDNVYVLAGNPVDLECQIPESNPRNTRWYKNGKSTAVESNIYHMTKASLYDDGNYTCRVNTENGSKSRTYVVDVGYKPSFEIIQDELVIWDGDNDNLDCSVKSKPYSEIKWFHNGQKMPRANSFDYSINDFGNYSCKVTNVHGRVDRNFTVTSEDCLISKSKHYSKNMPLISGTENTLQNLPTGYIRIKSGDRMTLKCRTITLPTNTFLAHPMETEITATCIKEYQYLVDGLAYNITQLQCENEIDPSIIETKAECLGKDTEIINVGYDNNEVYHVCLDKKTKRPLFAVSTLNDKNIGNDFGGDDEWIKTKYGSFGVKKTCDGAKQCCYEEGQLVNVIDVEFGLPQKATFLEGLNSVAVWNPCKNEKRVTWHKIEQEIRYQLNLYSQFGVWTGASTYELQDIGSIPRYLWKIIRSEDIAVAIVYVNNPSPNKEDVLCKTPVLLASDLGFESLTETGDDFTYICSINDFLKAFNISSNIFPKEKVSEVLY